MEKMRGIWNIEHSPEKVSSSSSQVNMRKKKKKMKEGSILNK